MADIPNLAGVATSELVESIGGGNFKASYINWARTVHLLHVNAPGWLPELVKSADEIVLHRAPVGAYLLIRFRHSDGTVTPEVPQAVMDSRNAAIAFEKVTARDLTDTHRRGVCMAAALTFGLAYELWAKVSLESGYAGEAEPEPEAKPAQRGNPLDGVWDSLNEETQDFIQKLADWCIDTVKDGRSDEAASYIREQNLGTDEMAGLWTRMDSKVRTPLKKALEGK